MILAGLINICGSNIRQTRILVVKTVVSAYLATTQQQILIYGAQHRSGLEMLGCGLSVGCAGVLDQTVRSPYFNRGRTFLHQQSQVLPHPPSGLRRVEPQVT